MSGATTLARPIAQRPQDPAASRARRSRLLVALLVLAVAAAVGIGVMRGAYREGPFEPSSPTPTGSRAVVEVLRDAGSDVQVRRSTLDAAGALEEGRTVLVTDPSALGSAQLGSLHQAHAAGTGRLVLVRPDFFALRALAPGIAPAGILPDSTELSADGSCGAASLRARMITAGPVDSLAPAATRYRTESGSGVCFDGVVVQGDRITVLGSATLLANETVGERDNAAVALNALGIDRSAPVTWYLPSASDPMAEVRPGLLERLPSWLLPIGLWIVLVSAALLLALSHRLGPVVVEPLPVRVRARELTLGRAALHQRSSARDRAARSLRAATAVRLAGRLGVRREESLDALIAALRGHTDATDAQLRALLGPTPITSDAALMRLASDLTHLEKEIDR